MLNSFKSNIIFKSLIVLLLGYFIFEFIFNLITRINPMHSTAAVASSHHDNSGNTYELIVNGLLLLLIKLLILLLFIILVEIILKLIKDRLSFVQYTIATDNKEVSNKFNILVVLFGTVISIMLVISIFNGFILGNRASNNMLDISRTNMFNLNLYNFFSIILNLTVYSIAIILGVEIFFYLERVIEKLKTIQKNNNELVQKDSKYLNKSGNIK